MFRATRFGTFAGLLSAHFALTGCIYPGDSGTDDTDPEVGGEAPVGGDSSVGAGPSDGGSPSVGEGGSHHPPHEGGCNHGPQGGAPPEGGKGPQGKGPGQGGKPGQPKRPLATVDQLKDKFGGKEKEKTNNVKLAFSLKQLMRSGR